MSEAATETTTETTETAATVTDQTEAAATDTGAVKDWEAEATKWKSLSRKHEDTAKANAEKAKRLDEIEEASKTEVQKAADRAAAAEAKATELEMRALRAEVAAEKKVPAELLSGSTKEELDASADALVAFRGEQPKPDFGAGGRGTDVGDKKAPQLTQEDVKKLYAEKKYSEIEKAREEGRLTNLLGG